MKLFEFDEHIGSWRVLFQTRDIQDKAITTRLLADGAVTEEKLENGAVTTEKLADNSVTGDKIKDGAISGEQLSEDFEVTNRMIANGAITSDKISGTFSGEKIADDTLPASKISGTIPNEKIANDTITGDKIANGAVTESKLAGSIPASKLANGAVTNEKMLNGSVTNEKIANNAVTGDKIQDKTITRDKIAPGAIEELNGLLEDIADDEDLTVVHKNPDDLVLKFKDKTYNASVFSGLGRKYLRKNIQNNKNVLTQADFPDANTIYVIQYDYDLNGATVTVPEGCTLKFDGGSIKNGSIVLNNTCIISDRISCILPVCSGTCSNDILYPEWFADGNDFSDAIQTCIDIRNAGGCTILFTGVEYLISKEITFGEKIAFKSECKSRIYSQRIEAYRSMFYAATPGADVVFDGLFFDQSEELNATYTGVHPGMVVILNNKINSLTVRNCKFVYCGTNCISSNGLFRNSCIENNDIEFVHLNVEADYDTSAIYINDRYHKVIKNRIKSTGVEGSRMHGGIETHGYCGDVSNNTISNCNNGINIVTNQYTPSDSEANNRIISGNIVDGVYSFVTFWGVSSFNPIKNIEIFGNNVTNSRSFASAMIGGDYRQKIECIDIHSNVFVGRKVQGSLTLQETYSEAVFFFQHKGSMDNIYIHNNYIYDAPIQIIATNPYSKNDGDGDVNIYFLNNVCINCFNSNITLIDNKYLTSYYALFFLGVDTSLTIKENTFEVNNISRTLLPILARGSNHTPVNFVFRDNNFTKLQVSRIYFPKPGFTIDADLEAYPQFNNKRKTNFDYLDIPSHLYIDDTITYPDKFEKVTGRGDSETVNIDVSGEGVNMMCYNELVFPIIHLSDDSIIVGDILHLRSTYEQGGETKNKEIYVMVHFNDGTNILAELVASALIASTEYTLQWMKKEKYPASVVGSSGTFANKPAATDIYVGFKYFCTDKQTVEGATNGIEIIHKGSDVWVDALGRVVS